MSHFWFFTAEVSPGRIPVMALLLKDGSPLAIAVVSAIVLNVEPGWRRALVTKLN